MFPTSWMMLGTQQFFVSSLADNANFLSWPLCKWSPNPTIFPTPSLGRTEPYMSTIEQRQSIQHLCRNDRAVDVNHWWCDSVISYHLNTEGNRHVRSYYMLPGGGTKPWIISMEETILGLFTSTQLLLVHTIRRNRYELIPFQFHISSVIAITHMWQCHNHKIWHGLYLFTIT